MTDHSRISVRRDVAAVTVAALLVAGAGVSYLTMRGRSGAANRTSDGADQPATVDTSGDVRTPGGVVTTPGPAEPLPDIVVQLTPEGAERAGIVASPVDTALTASGLRMPGVVEPNAYRQVAVTPLVAGRVTRVSAELGDRVRQGETMAQVYSPELAEAKTRYISARAELEAHEQELQRTHKLAEIGAASRQELERTHAVHTAHTANVQSARSRLELLGVAPSELDKLAPGTDVEATTNVPAPMDGVVTERLANVGLNVDQTASLFTVVDLSTVWVVADLYETDFARVRPGSAATVTTTAYPDLVLQGHVSYIDPRVNPDTRTAKVRVEVPNPRQELRLGMYADVVIADDGSGLPVIPRSAVQNVGDRQVVYLADPAQTGRFTEREVRLGRTRGDHVEVVSGVQPGDAIVTSGSFLVRAERERLGLRGSAASAPPPARLPDGAQGQQDMQTAHIVVGALGYEPASVTLRAGTPARLTFVRTTDQTCGTEVVFPSLNIRRALPLNEPVLVEFTPDQAGEVAFACGLSMLSGTVVIE